MLGRTMPEMSKKHGRVVCSAGYSKELGGFVRLYPISEYWKIPRWSVLRVPVERPNCDNRKESWRIRGDVMPEIVGKVQKDEQFGYLRSIQASSIDSLNDSRMSLGIIEPRRLAWRFDKLKPNEEYQMELLPKEETQQQHKPRLMFDDADGPHDLQLRDWGCQCLLNKGYERHQLWEALKLTDSTYDHLLFVGNHNHHRMSWLVISLISKKSNRNYELFG